MKKLLWILLIFFAPAVMAAEPIKIANISSYSSWNEGASAFRQGVKIAVEEINQAGGLLGRPVEVAEYDDRGTPASAVQVAENVFNDKTISFITGCNLANVELALSSYAKRYKRLYTSGCSNSDKFFLSEAHPYAFRISGTPVDTFNKMLAERAARSGKLRWATVNHSYEWGQGNLAAFKKNLKIYQPNAKWMAEQWTPIGKINANAVVQALLRAKPDAIYTALWGSDLTEFIRAGKKYGLFDGRIVVGDNIGRPEFLEQLGAEMPAGFITVGVLPDQSDSPSMKTFAAKWRKEAGTNPRHIGMVGYAAMQTLAAAIRKANSTDQNKMITALKGLHAQTVYGTSIVHPLAQVTTNPMWIGETAIQSGKAVVTKAEYKNGVDYFMSDAEIKKGQGKK